MNIEVRHAVSADLPSISQIQAACPEAAQWEVPEYLKYELTVALCDMRIAGFAAARDLAGDESELLNLAVDPACRRRGIARCLVLAWISAHPGILWLEVRESNVVARKFYKSLGFNEVGQRADYYAISGERAIVMNVHS